MMVKLEAKDIIEMIKTYYKVVEGIDVDITYEIGGDTYYGYGTEVCVYIGYAVGFGKFKAQGKTMLTDDKLIEILNYYLEDGNTIDNIKCLTKAITKGYGIGEHTEYIFDGINVTLVNNKVKKLK